MADWYVDSAATGTNSGDTPTNAAINLTSLSFAAASAGVMWGDRIWVRRTYVHSITNTIGRSGFNANSTPMIDVIGWPSSGDPFFEQRPAAGTSAGWDADGAQFAGMPWPTLPTSRSTVSAAEVFATTNKGVFLTNWAVISSPAVSAINFTQDVGIRFGKFGVLNCIMTTNVEVDDLTLVLSYSSSEAFNNYAYLNRLTLTSSCVLPTGVFTNPRWVGDLNNNCASVSGFINRLNGDAHVSHFGYVRGTKPNNPNGWVGIPSAGKVGFGAFVEDWYGEGPRRIGPSAGWDVSVVGSSIASYSGANSVGAQATMLSVSSVTTGARIPNEILSYSEFGGVAKGHLAVNSGMTYQVRLPFYVTNANCLDGHRNAFIELRGAISEKKYRSIQDGNIVAGSPARWQGTSISAGSAYLMVHTFVPLATGTVCITARPPVAVNVLSAFYAVAPFFEVST